MTNERDITKAVALFFDGDHAPQVTAKGSGQCANDIIDIAQKHQIPLMDNPELAELLTQLELDDEIPESLYLTVAHIISFSYQLQLRNL